MTAAATSGIQAYFNNLQFSGSAQQAQIAAVVANTGLGLFQSLTVTLYPSGSSTAVPAVTASYNNRVVLAALAVNIK